MDLPSCFANDSDSDTDLPPVKKKPIKTIVIVTKPKEETKPKLQPKPDVIAKRKKGTKDSQISRLVARRNLAMQQTSTSSNPDQAVFSHDLSLCGEQTTYDTPIDAFGELMLKKMGWNGKRDTKKDAKLVPRPSRLGLGAKPSSKPPTANGANPSIPSSGKSQPNAQDGTPVNPPVAHP